MIGTRPKYFLLGSMAGGVIVFFALFFSSSSRDADLDRLAVERAAQTIQCPAPAKLQYEGWSKSGMIANCKIEHGPFVAIEGGVIAMKGVYSMGKPSGEWIWFDRSGNVEKKVQK